MGKTLKNGLKFWIAAGIGMLWTLALTAFAAAALWSLPSATSGTSLSSTAWNDIVAHVNLLAQAPFWQISSSAGTSIASWGGLTKIALGSSAFSRKMTTSGSRLTPTEPGYYECEAELDYVNGSTASSLHHAYIIKNWAASSFAYGYSQSAGAGTYLKAHTSWITFLNGTTDYVELYGWQNTWSTQTTGTNSVLRCVYIGAQ